MNVINVLSRVLDATGQVLLTSQRNPNQIRRFTITRML